MKNFSKFIYILPCLLLLLQIEICYNDQSFGHELFNSEAIALASGFGPHDVNQELLGNSHDRHRRAVCECNVIGSVNLTCDTITGQCYCHPGVEGLNCDRCMAFHYGFSERGCERCECDPLGSK